MTDAKLMNPLQQYPHLFANGEFKIRINGDGISADHAFDAIWLDRIKRVNNIDCTLIARPISNMTDEECTESILFECLKDKAEPKYIRKELVEMNYFKRTMRLSLYLLSIGVYPFDQSHFDDGTVIDVNTL